MKFLKNVKTDEFMATVTRTASKYGYKLKKASPTIMIFGAAIVGVAATVSACKATVKAQDILEDHNEMVKAIHETKEKVDSGEMILKERRCLHRERLQEGPDNGLCADRSEAGENLCTCSNHGHGCTRLYVRLAPHHDQA